MNRAAWVFLLLLLATNLAWIGAWRWGGPVPGADPPPARAPADPEGRADAARLEAEILRLRAELARRGGPSPPAATGDPAGARRARPSGDPPADPLLGAWAQSQKWIDDARQIENPVLRDAALGELLSGLTDGEGKAHLAALLALPALFDVDFDRDPCRSAALRALSAKDPRVRRAAAAALASLRGGEPEVEALLPLTRDPDRGVRMEAGMALLRLSRASPSSPASPGLVALLRDPDPEVARRVLDEIGRYRPALTPEVVEAILSCYGSDDERTARTAASTICSLGVKPESVVDALLAHLASPGTRDKQQIVESLREGVAPDLFGKVAAAFFTQYGREPDGSVRLQIREWFKLTGAGDPEALERLAENPLLPEKERTSLREIAGEQRRRPVPPR